MVTILKSFSAKVLQPLWPQKAQAGVELQTEFSKAKLKKLSIHLNSHHLTLAVVWYNGCSFSSIPSFSFLNSRPSLPRAQLRVGVYYVVKMTVAQSCLTLWDPMDGSPQGSSIHGILQWRILQWVAISFYRGSSWPGDGIWSPTLQADSLPSESPGKPI